MKWEKAYSWWDWDPRLRDYMPRALTFDTFHFMVKDIVSRDIDIDIDCEELFLQQSKLCGLGYARSLIFRYWCYYFVSNNFVADFTHFIILAQTTLSQKRGSQIETDSNYIW